MTDTNRTSKQCAIHGDGPCICLGARYWMDRALSAERRAVETTAPHGPGTLEYRFDMLCKALATRFGVTENRFAAKPREIDILEAIDMWRALKPSPEEPTRHLPPRQFDVESHTGLYTEPEKASGEQP